MWRAKMARFVADDRGRIDAPSTNVADQGVSESRCPSAALSQAIVVEPSGRGPEANKALVSPVRSTLKIVQINPPGIDGFINV